jgi:hypothetical protein
MFIIENIQTNVDTIFLNSYNECNKGIVGIIYNSFDFVFRK